MGEEEEEDEVSAGAEVCEFGFGTAGLVVLGPGAAALGDAIVW